MTDVASLGVWPLGTFAWCVRSARTAPFRTRSLRAALLTSRLPLVGTREILQSKRAREKGPAPPFQRAAGGIPPMR
jgi:hypothetical protein